MGQREGLSHHPITWEGSSGRPEGVLNVELGCRSPFGCWWLWLTASFLCSWANVPLGQGKGKKYYGKARRAALWGLFLCRSPHTHYRSDILFLVVS
jgi:hypothetical protein